MNVRRSIASLLALVVALTCVGGIAAASPAAAPIGQGQTVLVSRPEAAPGERVRVSVEGFDASYVTVSICGNEARRGSRDCDMVGSKGFELLPDGALSWTEMLVTAPPAPCPCVVRVSTPTSDVVSVASFKVTGHPVEEVAAPRPDDPLVEVTVRPVQVSNGLGGWLRSGLGGGADFDVTVSVHNLTADTLRRVSLEGSVGRDEFDISTTFDLKNPGVLSGGQTTSQVVRVRVPAPTIGTFVWRVSASGAGPIVTTLVDHRDTPWLLVVLLVVLVLDIGLLATRWLTSRRARIAAQQAAAAAAVPHLHDDNDFVVDVESREMVDV